LPTCKSIEIIHYLLIDNIVEPNTLMYATPITVLLDPGLEKDVIETISAFPERTTKARKAQQSVNNAR
jgi:hypothetical protein